MSTLKSVWQTDWTQFIQSVADDLEHGLTNTEVTDKYRDQPVEWIGTVLSTHFDNNPVVKLAMPAAKVSMADGRHGVVDYLNLFISPDDVSLWQQVKAGQLIRFRTSIGKGFGPFPGLEWADLGNKKGYVSIATNPSILLEVIVKTPDVEAS